MPDYKLLHFQWQRVGDRDRDRGLLATSGRYAEECLTRFPWKAGKACPEQSEGTNVEVRLGLDFAKTAIAKM